MQYVMTFFKFNYDSFVKNKIWFKNIKRIILGLYFLGLYFFRLIFHLAYLAIVQIAFESLSLLLH